MLAVISLNFDPATSLFGMSLRLETLALAGTIFIALVLAALVSGRSRAVVADSDGAGGSVGPRLRRDDLILIGFGAVPGAVIGGRLGYALIHYDYYSTNPNAILDPGQGGLALTLSVVLGTMTAIAVAGLLAAPVRRWLDIAAVPVLIGLGLGKLAMVLGGSGQGSYSDASWATSYAGPGPWNTFNPTFSAVPSQAIEGALVLAVAALVLAVPFALRFRIRRWWRIARPGLAPQRHWGPFTGGRRYLTVIGLWAIVRFAVEFTWRDARVLGPLVADQLVLLPIATFALLGPPVGFTARRLRASGARRLADRRVAREKKKAEAAEAAERAAAAATEAARQAEIARVADAELAAAEAAEQAASADKPRLDPVPSDEVAVKQPQTESQVASSPESA